MNSSPSLKTILKEVKERDEVSGRLANKTDRIELRRKGIEELFDSIQGWLQPSVDEGLVELRREVYVHSDKQLGMLTEESLTLVVGASEIFVAPRAGSIAGATVRVDITRNELTLPVVLMPDRGWHFLIRDQITRTEPVTEASFVEVLKELLAA